MVVSRLITIGFGALIISLALFLNSLKELSLFDAMLLMSALLGFPQMIPSFLGFFIRKTPDWAAWATIIVGAIVSYIIAVILQPEHVENLLGLPQELTKREWTDIVVAASLISHIIITGGFFCLTTLFYKGLSPERDTAVARFFTNRDTPVVKGKYEHAHLDNQQRIILGRMIAIAGIFVMSLMIVPNPLGGRLLFLGCGIAVLIVGVLLFSSVTDIPADHNDDNDNEGGRAQMETA